MLARTAIAPLLLLAASGGGALAAEHSGTVVGQVGGTTYAVAVSPTSDGIVYAGVGPRLVVLDATRPDRIAELGRSGPLGGIVRAIVVRSDTAYVAAEDAGVAVFDVSDPRRPLLLAVSAAGGEARDLALHASYLYVAAWGAGLVVFDVSLPSAPRSIGRFGPRGANAVVADEGFAYVSYLDDGVRVFDLSEPVSPTIVAALPAVPKADGLAVQAGHLFVGMGSGTGIADVHDPTAPAALSRVPSSGYSRVAAPAGDIVFVANGEAGIQVIDAHDPTQPRVMAVMATPGPALDLALSGDSLYIASWLNGVVVADVRDPASPRQTASYAHGGYAFGTALSQGRAYVAYAAHGLAWYAAADPSALDELGFTPLSGQRPGLALDGDLVLTVDRVEGRMSVFDASDPAGLLPLSTFPVRGNKIATLDGMALVTLGSEGIEEIDVTDPRALRSLGHLDTPGAAAATVVSGTTVYVADGDSGVLLLDATRPDSLREISTLDTPGDANDVAVQGRYMYVADGGQGLQVVDVSDPGKPRAVANVPVPPGKAKTTAVALVSNGAFLGFEGDGMQVVDVSQPTEPRPGVFLDTPGSVQDLYVANGLVYAAAGAAGLIVVDPEGELPPVMQVHVEAMPTAIAEPTGPTSTARTPVEQSASPVASVPSSRFRSTASTRDVTPTALGLAVAIVLAAVAVAAFAGIRRSRPD